MATSRPQAHRIVLPAAPAGTANFAPHAHSTWTANGPPSPTHSRLRVAFIGPSVPVARVGTPSLAPALPRLPAACAPPLYLGQEGRKLWSSRSIHESVYPQLHFSMSSISRCRCAIASSTCPWSSPRRANLSSRIIATTLRGSRSNTSCKRLR